jgi:hypothetical protein
MGFKINGLGDFRQILKTRKQLQTLSDLSQKVTEPKNSLLDQRVFWLSKPI